jgi:hypothetical protein
MAIPSINYPREISSSTQDQNLPSVADSKQSVNRAILQLVDTSYIASKEYPLQLTYQTAVAKINEQLEVEFGPSALDEAVESGLDVSPEETASRIVSMATGFFAAFREQHPDENEDAVLQIFMQTISSGIDQGFAEAREVLDGLAVLQGDVADDIDETYLLVQDRLIDFEGRHQSED